MISAQSHLPLLNGNKSSFYSILLIIFTCLMLSSCDALKKVPREEPKQNEELDEIKGRRVYNPATGQWEVSTEVESGVMDTIVWTDPGKDVPPPITSDGGNDNKQGAPGVNTKKEIYNVAVLLPFMTNNFDELSDRLNPKSELAIHLYGGMQMAFSELSGEGVMLNVSVHDTQASEAVTKNLLENDKVKEADLIIGPISKSNLKLVSDHAKTQKKPMVSPLSPSVSITTDNPYYLQVSPGLEAHCKAITRHALDKYKPEQLVLVSRNKSAETNRLKYFQNANKEITGTDAELLKEFIVTDETVEFSEMDVAPYILPGKTTVFIVPSWSNESFIYSLMRKISIAKGQNKVVIYGMPQWMEFEQISYDYYENLNLHVSSDMDINNDHEEIKRFKLNFYNKFGTLPQDEAYVGYDVMRYFGKQLFEVGTQFQEKIDQNGRDLLHTRFSMMPVAPKGAKSEDYSKIERYENEYVNILKFENFHFQLAD